MLQPIQFVSLIVYSVMLHAFSADDYTLGQHAASLLSIVFTYILPSYVQIMMPLQAFRTWAPLNYVNYRTGPSLQQLIQLS